MKIRKISKVIAFLLCIGMILTIFAFNVSAEESEPSIQGNVVDSITGEHDAIFVKLQQ